MPVDEDGGECTGLRPSPPDARPEPDLYGIMGVDRKATQAEIEQAFRSGMRRLQAESDHTRNDRSQRLDALTAAYDVLRRPDRRAEYDHRQGYVREQSDLEPAMVLARDDQRRDAPSHRMRWTLLTVICVLVVLVLVVLHLATLLAILIFPLIYGLYWWWFLHWRRRR